MLLGSCQIALGAMLSCDGASGDSSFSVCDSVSLSGVCVSFDSVPLGAEDGAQPKTLDSKERQIRISKSFFFKFRSRSFQFFMFALDRSGAILLHDDVENAGLLFLLLFVGYLDVRV